MSALTFRFDLKIMGVQTRQIRRPEWKAPHHLALRSALAYAIAATACSSEPVKAFPESPLPDLKPAKAGVAPRETPLDLPAAGGELPTVSSAERGLKRPSNPNALWQLPPSGATLEENPPNDLNSQGAQLPNAPLNQPQSVPSLLQGGPGERAAGYRAMTNAESMIDGLGGIPSTYDLSALGSGVPATGKLLRIGPLSLRTAVNIGVSYDYIRSDSSGDFRVNSRSSGGQTTESHFGPTIGAEFNLLLGKPATGRTLSLVYGIQYGNAGGDERGGSNSDQPLNQQLSMVGSLAFTKLKLGLGASYAGLSGANRDFGGKAERQLVTISLTSSYALTPKTSLDWDLSVPVRQVSGGLDSSAVTSTMFLNHLFNPKTEVGVGVTLGNESVQGISSQPLFPGQDGMKAGNTQTFERFLGRISYHPSPRFFLSGTFGFEFRAASDEQLINPVFSLSSQWILREGTSIGFSAAQIVQSSGSTANADYLSTSVTLAVSQRLGNRLNLNLSFGYEHAAYTSIQPGAAIDRVDHLYTGQVGLSCNLSRRWSASVDYVCSNNRSSTDGFLSSRGQLQMSFQF